MRKTARRNKLFGIFAISAIAVFLSFFPIGNTTQIARADSLVESIYVEGASPTYEDSTLASFRVFPSSSITDFTEISVTGTSAKFTFTVSLKDEVTGAKLTDSNEIYDLGGWKKIFENGGTTFDTKSDVDYAEGHGIYLDIATNKSKIVEQFPVNEDVSGADNFYTGSGAFIMDDEEEEAAFIESDLLGTFAEATSFINSIKNSDLLRFGGSADEINDSEASFPITVSVAQVKPDGFDVVSDDLDTIKINEVTVSNLYPNTTYYAQVRVEENIPDGTTDQPQFAISPTILKFTTGDGPVPSSAPVVSGVSADGASAVADDSDWFLGTFTCGIQIFSWQSDDTSLLDCIPIALYNYVYVPSSAILFFAGSMVDAFFSWSISSSIYRDSTFVVDGWRIIRDLSNIGFIVALVYAAVATILQLGNNIRRTVVSVIIIGLLINFSLFFSKVVIDAGNTLARVFYNQITISGVTGDTIIEAGVEVKSLSQAIVDGMDLQKIIHQDTLGAIRENSYGQKKYVDEGLVALMIILGIILNLTAAWAFFLISWTFVGRIVGLWLAMIVSPLAFLSRVVPMVGQMGGNFTMAAWFSNLLSLSFLAPIFIFLIYLLILLIDSGFLDTLIKAV